MKIMVVEIDKQIVITGIVALAGIYLALILTGQNDQMMGIGIVTIIGLSIGVVIPAPRIDNNKGVLIW